MISRTVPSPGRVLRILGTRGIPAQHGGFETFAERLALDLASKGWQVTVYCQADRARSFSESSWRGIRLVHVPAWFRGALGTIVFDLLSTLHAALQRELVLTLGYNTAVFCSVYRLRRIVNLINMDGIEWRRDKWSPLQRAWLYFNERMGCLLGSHLIADHPEIRLHLATRVSTEKIIMIPYGADRVTTADPAILDRFDLTPGGYALVIARPEPENSVLEIVSAFSAKRRGLKLVVLGKYEADSAYHQCVLAAASDEVAFVGAIYDQSIVSALRFFACLYVHGHSVGGTNPSLVEALGAGNPVLAHDNAFNRWVAGPQARYFKDARECEREFDRLLYSRERVRIVTEAIAEGHDPEPSREQILTQPRTLVDTDSLHLMKQASLERFEAEFTWDRILAQYGQLLSAWAGP